MCNVYSIAKTGRKHFIVAEGMTAKQAMNALIQRRYTEAWKELETFEQWQRILLLTGEFQVDAEDTAKRFSDFLNRARIDHETLPKDKWHNFITFKLV